MIIVKNKGAVTPIFVNRNDVKLTTSDINTGGGGEVIKYGEPDWLSSKFEEGYIKNRTHYIWNKMVDEIVDVTSTRAGETLVGGLWDGMVMHITHYTNEMADAVTCEVHLGNRVSLPVNGPSITGIFVIVDNAIALVQNNAGYGIDNVLKIKVYNDIKKLDDYYISPNIARKADVQETLISGENIKTINGITLLGSGDIEIQGGGDVIQANIVAITQSEYDEMVNNGTIDQETLYLITDAEIEDNFKTINGKAVWGNGDISTNQIVALTMEEYDNLATIEDDIFYVITDAEELEAVSRNDMEEYVTSQLGNVNAQLIEIIG